MFGRFMIAAALLVVSGVGTLFVVADLSRLQLDLQVTVKDAAAVEIGAAVEFVARAGCKPSDARNLSLPFGGVFRSKAIRC